ncbi:tyrosinase family oxidase copper chaperone [Streptomyces sp. NPDC054794]
MVMGASGTPTNADQGSGSPLRDGPGARTRRELGRGLLGSVAALALAPVVAASRPPSPGKEARHTDTFFDETYRGRRIRGMLLPLVAGAPAGAEWQITVDGRPLHLMRRADGTWLSMVDHYQSYRTPLEATRAAVDELGPGQRLRDLAPGPVGGWHAHTGGHYGVRA